MELNLTGKVAVISGGGTGIGKALALEYLKEGVQVCTFGRRLTVLEKFAQECRAAGYEIYYEQLDITDTKGLESYAARVFEKFGHLDIWVNNAGVDCVKEFSKFTQEDWDRVMKINLEGVFHGTQIAAEYMKKSGGGVILNASSYARLIPHANSVIYAASKSAVSESHQKYGSGAGALWHPGDRVHSGHDRDGDQCGNCGGLPGKIYKRYFAETLGKAGGSGKAPCVPFFRMCQLHHRLRY